jgi:hypothetical protein
MRRAYAISLIIIVLLAGYLAKSKPDTASELFPLASAIRWVEGNGRALHTEFIGSGIRPINVVKIGSDYVPRTPPALVLYYGAVAKVYSGIVRRPLDGADLPKLSKWVNFPGVIPWALLLFGGLVNLAICLGCSGGTKPIWAAWAAIAGSMAFQWFGSVSVYLPAAAISVWVMALIFRDFPKIVVKNLIYAGILAGFSGLFHPVGWLMLIFGLFYLFISTPEGGDDKSQARGAIFFGLSAVIPVIIVLSMNFVFFGSLLPVQWIDLTPITLSIESLIQLIWHDLAGWNGILWLAPLTGVGVYVVLKGRERIKLDSTVIFLLGIMGVVVFMWGYADDARMISENEGIQQEFRIMPIELVAGKFQIVQLAGESGDVADQRAFYERLYIRTDVFLWMGGRTAGLPVFLPIGIILALLGWCGMGGGRFVNAWSWSGIRVGGLIALMISQAPYGAISDLAIIGAAIPNPGHIPVIEAVLAVSMHLAELWPSGVVNF